MTPDQKLAGICRSLHEAGIDVLFMGGHAVRYYGVGRNTTDFDLVTAIATPGELRARLPRISGIGPVREEPVWRRDDFARFEIGTLADGRSEWLEFWLRNHLLASFADLKSRAEFGTYGGETIPFLGLSDLMRSKETERESDWQDIALLEEILDDRNRAAISTKQAGLIQFLSQLRSRRGMDFAVEQSLLNDDRAIAQATFLCAQPVTHAFLYPWGPGFIPPSLAYPILPTTLKLLSTVSPASTRHFALVEIARRDTNAMRWITIERTSRINFIAISGTQTRIIKQSLIQCGARIGDQRGVYVEPM